MDALSHTTGAVAVPGRRAVAHLPGPGVRETERGDAAPGPQAHHRAQSDVICVVVLAPDRSSVTQQTMRFSIEPR
jgi:hypothetical protein